MLHHLLLLQCHVHDIVGGPNVPAGDSARPDAVVPFILKNVYTYQHAHVIVATSSVDE